MARLSIPLPTTASPLNVLQVSQIMRDTSAEGSTPRISARIICQAYMDDFEEFCAAVNAGVISESYALDLEGSRVISVFYGLRPLIDELRSEQERVNATLGMQTAGQRPMRSKYYDELERVAIRWRLKREKEHKTIANSSRWIKLLLRMAPKV
jgi:hypothetical protein